VGFSRIYLGVHFLSDVLGGYLLGATWLILGITVIEWLSYKKELKNIPQ
jgi:undecaprenyl-diphosphatase